MWEKKFFFSVFLILFFPQFFLVSKIKDGGKKDWLTDVAFYIAILAAVLSKENWFCEVLFGTSVLEFFLVFFFPFLLFFKTSVLYFQNLHLPSKKKKIVFLFSEII